MARQRTILIVDYEDSFVNNIADEFRRRHCHTQILPESSGLDTLLAAAKSADLVVLGAGPGQAEDRLISRQLLDQLALDKPVLGICLGHQLLALAHGGQIERSARPLHGRATRIGHTGRSIFKGIPSPMEVGRYHSSIVSELPQGFDVLAQTEGDIMAMTHRSRPLIGLQFHPESILTSEGGCLIDKLLEQLSTSTVDDLYEEFVAGIRRDLSCFETLFELLVDGRLSAERSAAFLGALRRDPTDADRLASAARLLRARMTHVTVPRGAVDICGTGGDGAGTFNISTGASVVAAACGVTVAKHGNRAVSSACGAADVIGELGLPLGVERLASMGYGFLDARKHHPALKKLAPLRSSLGVRTLFNHLGPLLHPGSVDRQVVGVARFEDLRPTAGALLALGCRRGLVVYCEGCDELSLHGPSSMIHVDNGVLRAEVIHPSDVGLSEAPLVTLRGGDAPYNAALLRRIFSGEETGPCRDVVVFNAGAVLLVAGQVKTLKEGCDKAIEALTEGIVQQFVESITEPVHV